MRSYSMDLRRRVLAACDDGSTTAEVAEQFSVSPSWIRRLRQRLRETGSAAPRRYRRDQPPAYVRLEHLIRAAVAQAPDLTLKEYITRFQLPISVPTLSLAMRKLGLTLKKSRPMRRSSRGRM